MYGSPIKRQITLARTQICAKGVHVRREKSYLKVNRAENGVLEAYPQQIFEATHSKTSENAL